MLLLQHVTTPCLSKNKEVWSKCIFHRNVDYNNKDTLIDLQIFSSTALSSKLFDDIKQTTFHSSFELFWRLNSTCLILIV